MEDIISRNFLPENIKFYDGDNLEEKTYQHFVNDITFWKTILYEGYGIRPGHSIALYDKTIRYSYCTLFLAAAELGVRLIVIPEYPTRSDGRTNNMDAYLEKYGLIDLCILDDGAFESLPLLALTKFYGKQTISKEVFNTYEINDHDVYTFLKNNTLAKPDDILTVSTTSGSTGEPKLIPYTHKQLYRNAVRNTKVYEFKSSDRACHTRNMHHPFVLIDFFMPALHIIENHYQFVAPMLNSKSDGDVKKFVAFLNENKITQIAFSSRPVMEQALDYMVTNRITFDHDFNIILGGQYVPKRYLLYIKSTNIRKIIAIIGSTETMSPLLTKHLTADTDVDTYKENFLGWPPDNTYSYHLDGHSLSVTCPEIFTGSLKLEDKFEGNTTDGFYHLGRDNFYRINHITFQIDDISKIVKELFSGDFSICVDTHYQNLYLAVWSGTLDFDAVNSLLFSRLEITFTDFRYLDKLEFETGFKLDQPKLRNFFKERNQ